MKQIKTVMKQINTIDAVGHILCHDMTQIIPGERAGVLFKKGHIVREEDIPMLLSIGKEHLYVWEQTPGMIHENDAAQRLYALCSNRHILPSEVREGKIELFADCDGLLKIDLEKLEQINGIDDIIIATRHSLFPVKKGDLLAGTRVVPLVIEEEKLQQAEAIAAGVPLFEILPFNRKKAGIVTTGNEVFSGRIQDRFGPVIRQKLSEYSVEILGQRILSDDPEGIREAILSFIEEGADMILCTGGMSVDPDDTTPLAIRSTGAEIITYGAPVLPGAMFLMAYLERMRPDGSSGTLPIMGLPGCVMYSGRTIFDLILPRVMADQPLTKADFVRYGHGGLCLKCAVCTFPNCGFGK